MSRIDDLIQQAIEITEDAPAPSFDSSKKWNIYDLSLDEIIAVAKELSRAIDDIYELLEKM